MVAPGVGDVGVAEAVSVDSLIGSNRSSLLRTGNSIALSLLHTTIYPPLLSTLSSTNFHYPHPTFVLEAETTFTQI